MTKERRPRLPRCIPKCSHYFNNINKPVNIIIIYLYFKDNCWLKIYIKIVIPLLHKHRYFHRFYRLSLPQIAGCWLLERDTYILNSPPPPPARCKIDLFEENISIKAYGSNVCLNIEHRICCRIIFFLQIIYSIDYQIKK